MDRTLPHPHPLLTIRPQAVKIDLVATAIAVFLGFVLFIFGLDLKADQIRLIAILSVPLVAPMVAADLIVILRTTRHFREFLDPLETSTKRPVHALVHLLRLPVLAVARVFAVHFPVFGLSITAIAFWGNAHLDLGLESWQFAVFWTINLFLSAGHGIMEFFLLEAACRRVIEELALRPQALRAAHRRYTLSVGMAGRLFFVSVFVMLIPLLVLGFTLNIKTSNLLTGAPFSGDVSSLWAWFAVFICGASIFGYLMVRFLSASLLRSIEQLRRGMRHVQDDNLNVTLPIETTDEFAELNAGFNTMTKGLVEREQLRDAFGCYVMPELTERILREGTAIKGEEVLATVLFADIRDFTTLSERLSPEEVVRILNEYFQAVEPVIVNNHGWINKFGGDSLLAVFGAPVADEEHADHALEAGEAMLAAVAQFNRRNEGAPGYPVRIGIGISSGPLVAGTVGSRSRMEYTVIGDTVNVASRLEGLTKNYECDILLSEEALRRTRRHHPATLLADLPVKGKSAPVRCYALV